MKNGSKTLNIAMTAMMMCIIMVAILFIRVPIPFTQGYVHLGDAMIFLSVLILGVKYGAVAAALGGMLGDIVGGFPIWAPWTLCIKGIMAVILGLVIGAAYKKGMKGGKLLAVEIAGMVLAGAFMVAGYFVAEGIMYGNWVTAALGIPWNIGQFVVGMILALAIAYALCRTPARKYFTYNVSPREAETQR